MNRAQLWSGGAWLLTLCLAGCKPGETQPDSVTSVARRGPLKLTVEARPRQVWLGDPVAVTLRLETPDDYAVQLPVEADLSPLRARLTDSPDARPGPAGGLVWARSFAIEPNASGTLEIPPLVAKYGLPAAETQPALDNELASDALKIEVRSALTTQDSITRPRDITGTLLPERTLWEKLRLPLLMAGIVIACAAVLVVAWVWWRRRREAVPPVLPEIWALQALGEPERQDWIARGLAREFYYRLSEVVRTYIEMKFALAAPEMTTEEFLRMLAQNRSALPYDILRLRAFLEACDIVKYAAYSPGSENAEQALSSARVFVHETAAAAERAARQVQDNLTQTASPQATAAAGTGGQAA